MSDEVEEDPDKTLTLLPEDLHADEEPSVKVRTHRSDEEQSIRSVSDMMSPARSPVSLTEGSVDYEKEPVMSSTLVFISFVPRMLLICFKSFKIPFAK